MDLDKLELEKIYNQGYGFYWKGKGQAVKEVENNETEYIPYYEGNLYIEGDNLTALKRLQKDYQGKIKCIYIDPPYNTNKKFIYNDKFSKTKKDSLSKGDRIHTNWLNMMYPRLTIARDLLSDDGVIFISISNEEFGNLKKICDEIFGESNYVETYLWEKTSTPPSLSNKSRKTVEYILCYEKNKNTNKYFGEMLKNEDIPLLNIGNMPKELIFPKGTIQFKIDDGIYSKGLYEKVELLNDVEVYEGVNREEVRLKGSFRWTQEKLDEEISKGTYFLVKTDKFLIRYQRENNGNFKTPNNFLGEIKFDKKNKIGTNITAFKELEELKMGSFFDYPKPQSLIKSIVNFITYQDKESIILDFFSGSATTAHAVMQLNAEDGGDRKFIMVQLPENCEEKSEAYKAGYKNICEIGKERIRRAGAKIKSDEKLSLENREKLDIGFKVVKL